MIRAMSSLTIKGYVLRIALIVNTVCVYCIADGTYGLTFDTLDRGGSGSSEVVRPGSGCGHVKWWVWLGVALTS